MKKQMNGEPLSLFAAHQLRGPEAVRPEGSEHPAILDATISPTGINSPYFADVDLLVAWHPDQTPRPFRVRSNIGGDGAIGMVVCNQRILLVKQWRVPLGRHTWEIPRGLSDPVFDTAASDSDLPAGLRTALREVEEEAGTLPTPLGWVLLGQLFENSGTHTNAPSYWLLELPADTPVTETPQIKWVPFEMAVGIVEDNHSTAACLLYLRYLVRSGSNIASLFDAPSGNGILR